MTATPVAVHRCRQIPQTASLRAVHSTDLLRCSAPLTATSSTVKFPHGKVSVSWGPIVRSPPTLHHEMILTLRLGWVLCGPLLCSGSFVLTSSGRGSSYASQTCNSDLPLYTGSNLGKSHRSSRQDPSFVACRVACQISIPVSVLQLRWPAMQAYLTKWNCVSCRMCRRAKQSANSRGRELEFKPKPCHAEWSPCNVHSIVLREPSVV